MRGIQQVSYQPKNLDKGGACAACSCSPASWQALCTPSISRLLKTMCKIVVANQRRSCKCLLCEGLTAGTSYPLEYMSVVMRTLLSAHPCSRPSGPCSNCCTVRCLPRVPSFPWSLWQGIPLSHSCKNSTRVSNTRGRCK